MKITQVYGFADVLKKMNYFSLSTFSFILLISCSDSVSDEFEQVNGDVVEKQIEKITVVSAQDDKDDTTLYLYYDGEDRLSSISNGLEATTFNYEGDKLSNVGGDDMDAFNVEELYKSPYDAFETGQVLEYDDNGNPHIIQLLEEDYDYYTDEVEVLQYTAEITYDDVHNPYYYTLQSAGIIEVMDKVQLNFSTIPQSSKVVKTRLLFPVNNPSKIVYKNQTGIPQYQIEMDYTYDDDNYPISASVTRTSLTRNETFKYFTSYTYR